MAENVATATIRQLIRLVAASVLGISLVQVARGFLGSLVAMRANTEGISATLTGIGLGMLWLTGLTSAHRFGPA